MPELRKVYTTVDARDRIVAAALTVFAKHGFDGATTREIAAEAGVSAALIHHHFKDKESLWNLVGQRISDEFIEALQAALAHPQQDTGASMRQMLAAYMRYWRAHPQSLRFQLWRVLGAPRQERKSRSQQLNQLFVPVVQAAQAAGVLRDDVPPGLLLVTMGGLVQYFLHSDVEASDALAVTGAAMPSDPELLDYLWGLLAQPAGLATGQDKGQGQAHGPDPEPSPERGNKPGQKPADGAPAKPATAARRRRASPGPARAKKED
ncbi:MAG: HTH-type transcriptional regulator BetI [Kerstersia gyiorum]|uniref:TetR/AcrR family transcriptional regulator n=1 Tax=Kerstersia gyiorum TaxID=206506 RepID=UPI0030D121BB